MSRIKDYLMDIEEGRIVPGEIQDKSVCADHFDSTFLQKYIKENGNVGEPNQGDRNFHTLTIHQ